MGKRVKERLELHQLLDPCGPRMVVRKPIAVGRRELARSKGGIIKPAQHEFIREEYGFVCEVVKVGPEVVGVKEGDTVLCAAFSGLPVFNDSEESDAWIITESEVLAVVDPRYWTDYLTADVVAPLETGETTSALSA